MNTVNEAKTVIGRRDLIDLPDFDITNLSAKVDTGAYTSALHASEIRLIQGSADKLSFRIVGLEQEYREIVTEDFSERMIKNSFGDIERRYVVKLNVLVFNKNIITEFSLSDRSSMKHPVLLGRKFLRGRFVVDVSRLNLSYKQKRRKERRKLT